MSTVSTSKWRTTFVANTSSSTAPANTDPAHFTSLYSFLQYVAQLYGVSAFQKPGRSCRSAPRSDGGLDQGFERP
jgi:hypothetical protein